MPTVASNSSATIWWADPTLRSRRSFGRSLGFIGLFGYRFDLSVQVTTRTQQCSSQLGTRRLDQGQNLTQQFGLARTLAERLDTLFIERHTIQRATLDLQVLEVLLFRPLGDFLGQRHHVAAAPHQ